jgi:carbon monoxide dehydrogenase subunit G
MHKAPLPVLVVTLAILAAQLVAASAVADAPVISVRDAAGTYVVSAEFSVTEPAAVVRGVLTDYEQIPRFMPGVRTSRVLERSDGYARVEQEAVSRFMMFSKRVHLILDVAEQSDAIRFRDRCGQSFARYEGVWTIVDRGDRTDVAYTLSADPAFDVPGFVLRKLLDRDARAMIDGLRSEMARAVAR